MTSLYVGMAEIVKKLKLNMPVQLTIHDPITGGEVVIDRDNLLAMLVIDTPDILYDSQWLAALYMEMSRARRASERASAHAERQFVKWKAEVAMAARAKSEKKLTGVEAEEAYRTHSEYEQRAGVSAYYKTLADLFEDAQQAFTLKARMIESQSRILMGDNFMRRAEDHANTRSDRGESTAELADRAAKAIAAAKPPRTPRTTE